MAWLQKQLQKYLGIDKMDTNIRREVRMQMSLAEIEKLVTSEDELKHYYEQLNQVFYRGNPTLLEKFYKTILEPYDNYSRPFWKQVSGDMIRMHYPLAGAISRAMSSMLFSEEVVMKVDTGNKKTSEDLTKRLWKILEDNNFMELFQRGAQLESYSGSLAAKIVVDSEFSEYPQVQFYPQEQIELETKYGKITEIIFKDEHVYDGKKYMLKSRYGKGYIRYQLYNDKRLVPVSSIPELADLKDMVILGPDGEPVKFLLAAFKPNRVVSSTLMNSNYGASDYEGLYSLFNALDELLSVWNDHYRNGRITTFLTEDQLQKDPMTGNVIKPSIYGLNTVILYDADTKMDNKTEVKRDIPTLSVQAFKDGFDNYIKVALQKAGLSQITFGFDSVARLAAAESLQEREKTTLKTRQDKIKLWTEFLTRLAKLLFVFDEITVMTPAQGDGEIVYQLASEWNFNYLVEWAQYDSPSKEEQVRNIAFALKSNLIDIDTAYHILYDDEYSEENIVLMIQRAKEQMAMGKKPMTPAIQAQPESEPRDVEEREELEQE
jgi:hypothetical protein